MGSFVNEGEVSDTDGMLRGMKGYDLVTLLETHRITPLIILQFSNKSVTKKS